MRLNLREPEVQADGTVIIYIYRARAFQLDLQQTDADLVPAPFALGTVARSEVREEPGAPLVVDFTCEVLEADGIVRLSLSAAETADLEHGGRFDVAVQVPGEDPEAFVTGYAEVVPQVTEFA